MGHSRHFVALSFTGLCAVSGCGTLIGLGDYGVADGSAGSHVGSGNTAGGGALEGGMGGETNGEGGAAGVPEESAGSAGEAGAPEAAGAGGAGAGSSGGGTSGVAGGGAPAACLSGCDDGNECTSDSCVMAQCKHDALPVGTACGVARTCDEQALCVRCRDTAAGTGQDVGCTPTAPICLGTGFDAACAGCTVTADCNDGNDCTSESCSNGRCVFTPVAAGTACAGGVCNGSALAEKCVACADTAAGAAQDAGCTTAKPVCDPSGTPVCGECLRGADCAADNVGCTVETCVNHQCSHVPTNSMCTPSGDACKPNRCDASLDCKQVDISTQLTLLDANTGNGSFELGSEPPTGWAEDGPYHIAKDCGTTGCRPGSNSGLTKASAGRVLAWHGGEFDTGVGDLSTTLTLPAGIRTLRIQADINFQTQSKATSNMDYFRVRLMDASYAPIGSPLFSKSAADAVTGPMHPWITNGIDVTSPDLSLYAGKVISISFWASCDTSQITDFFFDNVRVSATVCQ